MLPILPIRITINQKIRINFIPYIIMKPSQLVKFKTELDPHANYNSLGMYEAKKQIYEEEIDFVNFVESTSDRVFPLKPLQAGFVQSLSLQNDPKFKEIQKTYAKYNSEVAALGQRAINGLHLKTVVMDSMLKFMRMMMLAPNFQTKKTILDLSYYWFIKNINPRSQRKPKQQLISEIRQIMTDNRLLPKEIIQQELPSEKQKAEMYEFRIKARTCYTEFDAPRHELENFHTHKVGYMNDKPEKKREEEEEEQKRKKLARVQFPKPNLEQYYIQEVKQQEPPKEKQVQLPPLVPQVGPDVQPLPDAAVPPPQPENPLLAQQMEMLNQMGGQPEEPEEAVNDEDDEKKKGKLNPFVKVFLLKQQQQNLDQSFQPPSVANRERFRNNYKQELQRENEIFAKGMSDWAGHRTRLKSEISRKIQSTRAFGRLNVTTKESELPKVQETFYQTRINEAIREGKQYIKGELKRQVLNTETGLSCFDRKRAKTMTAGSKKPFSQILQENKRFNKRDDFLDEIQSIKDKFAKSKIYASLDSMKGGLMHSEEPDETERLDKVEYPVSLLSNPFFVVKKKKKKGKKKK